MDFGQPQGRIKNAMIRAVLQESGAKSRVEFSRENHPDVAPFLAQGSAGITQEIARETIQLTQELSSLKIDVVMTFFKLVHLFEHGNRNRNIVLVETLNAIRIVENHIGVQHENLGALLLAHSRFLCVGWVVFFQCVSPLAHKPNHNDAGLRSRPTSPTTPEYNEATTSRTMVPSSADEFAVERSLF